jgi:heavy metal sensor kinase
VAKIEMSLVNRVSLFFLGALALCLVGYSATMYWLIRQHLYREIDAQLANALNVIVAALEVEEDGVKWQPTDHAIQLGNERTANEVRWLIVDEQDRPIDSSRNFSPATEADQQLLAIAQTQDPSGAYREASQWRYRQQQVQAPAPKPKSERDLDEFSRLKVLVALPVTELHSELFNLALLAFCLPVGLWIAAALAGRAYCRRALKPVEVMAHRARSMTEADFDLRLPVPAHRDELADLASAFNSLLDRLRESYSRQQRFAGDAAHQLRTPLTVLRGQLDVALRRDRSSTEYRTILEELSQQTQELQGLVESLLFLARSGSGQDIPDLQQIEIGTWLPKALSTWQSHPRWPDLSIQVSQELPLRTSPLLLHQAIDNLVSNALKYSAAGSPVVVSAAGDHESVVISVEDRGCGIPESELASIFEPFFRSRQARLSGMAGTGLGLAIVAQIADALGGSVQCENVSPSGTRFVLRLPPLLEEFQARTAAVHLR